ncbi:hypothetical protein PHYSODRAFT_405964, partial [Phytophthora sojae]
ISTAEIEAAIAACKEGKASVPDLVVCSWYRSYADQLVPILSVMLNKWYAAGVFPESFLEADIFCLKKSGDLHNPLNYRPIALLNTDYKIFSRILATRRVRETLDDRVHPHQ